MFAALLGFDPHVVANSRAAGLIRVHAGLETGAPSGGGRSPLSVSAVRAREENQPGGAGDLPGSMGKHPETNLQPSERAGRRPGSRGGSPESQRSSPGTESCALGYWGRPPGGPGGHPAWRIVRPVGAENRPGGAGRSPPVARGPAQAERKPRRQLSLQSPRRLKAELRTGGRILTLPPFSPPPPRGRRGPG